MNARNHNTPAGRSTARIPHPAENHMTYLASGLKAAAGSPHGGQS